jgi:hypothetical protein
MAFSPQPFATTAADLNFLHSEAQNRIGNVKSGSGAGIMGWPEPKFSEVRFEIREGWML